MLNKELVDILSVFIYEHPKDFCLLSASATLRTSLEHRVGTLEQYLEKLDNSIAEVMKSYNLDKTVLAFFLHFVQVCISCAGPDISTSVSKLITEYQDNNNTAADWTRDAKKSADLSNTGTTSLLNKTVFNNQVH